MDIGGRSIRWLLAAALIGGAAVLESVAVALVWRPCAGQMLNGSILVGGAYPTEFTDACLAAMDGAHVFPLLAAGEDFTWAAASGTASAALLASAWLLLLPAFAVRGWTWLMTALPGLSTLGGVAAVAVWSLEGSRGGWSTGTWLLLLANLSVPVALLALRRAGLGGTVLVRAAVVAVAAAAPGVLSRIAEFYLSVMLSDANWDTPPGTGWLTAAFCCAAAVGTAVGWWRSRARGPAGSYAGGQPEREPAPS